MRFLTDDEANQKSGSPSTVSSVGDELRQLPHSQVLLVKHLIMNMNLTAFLRSLDKYKDKKETKI